MRTIGFKLDVFKVGFKLDVFKAYQKELLGCGVFTVPIYFFKWDTCLLLTLQLCYKAFWRMAEGN